MGWVEGEEEEEEGGREVGFEPPEGGGGRGGAFGGGEVREIGECPRGICYPYFYCRLMIPAFLRWCGENNNAAWFRCNGPKRS